MATILIVDDHAPSRAFLKAVLEFADHRVLQAADGDVALALCHQHSPELVISDILMPNMDGYELVRKIRAAPSLAGIPVIFFTAAYREGEAVNMARTCGVDSVIGKFSDPERILQLVRSALGAEATSPAAVPAQLATLQPPRISVFDDRLPHYLADIDLCIQRLSRPDLAPAQLAGDGTPPLQHLQSVSLRLTALIELGIQLAAEHDPRQLLELGCRLAQDICVARYATLCLVDLDGEAAGATIRRGWTPTRLDWGRRAWRGRPGAAPAGRQPGNADSAGNASEQPGWPHGHPRIRNSLRVPITTCNGVYGWILLANKLGEQQFSEIDERIALTVAAQLALAHENLARRRKIADNHTQLELDLALRKQSEQRLRISDQALQSVSQAVVITGADMLIISVNQAFSTITGHSPADVVGRNCRFLQGTASAPATLAAIRSALRAGVEFSGEVLNYRKDGQTFWNDLTISPVHDTQGKLVNFVGVLRDISTRKRAEQDLLASQDSLRDSLAHKQSILDSMVDGVITINMQGRMESFNQAACTIFGYTAQEAIGQNVKLLMPEPFHSAHDGYLRHFHQTGQARVIGQPRELTGRRKDGATFPLGLSVSQIARAGQTTYIGLVRDISERTRAETTLRENASQLQALSRRVLAAQETERRRMAIELHDELGQALTAVKINLQTQARSAGRPPDQFDADNLRIVDDALQQVRRLALALRPSMLDDLGLVPALRWIAEQAAARSNFVLDLRIPERLERLPPDMEIGCFRIVQEALTNIARHANASHVRISLEIEPRRLLLQVSDDGCGFDLANMRKQAVAGASVGVLGMQERATLIGGQLEIVSAPQRGTCVSLRCALRPQELAA